jgi:hypothetical protein
VLVFGFLERQLHGGRLRDDLGLRFLHGGLGLERQLRSQCQLQFGQLGNGRRLDIQRWLHVDWQLWLQQRLGGRIELERKLGQLGVERSG